MTYFTERQRFTAWWLWILLLGAAALVWWAAWVQLVEGRPFGTNPASDWGMLLVWLLAGVALPWLFLAAQLRTEVRDDGIHVRFRPFHLRERSWSFDEIAGMEPRRYSPMKEFGGWGIRLGPAGWAYNTSGDLGIQLVLRSGKRILIGTQDPDGFMAGVAEARRHSGGGRAARGGRAPGSG